MDGKKIYDSGVFSKGKVIDVNVSLRGGRLLEMEIDPTADGISGDCLRLTNPFFMYRGAVPRILDVNASGEGPKQPDEIVKRLEAKIKELPVMEALLSDRTPFDWLLMPEKAKAGIYRSADGKDIIVANEMVSRTFRVVPNLATVDFTNRMSGESMLRAVSGEGAVWIDGKKWRIGGLSGQPERGYLKKG